MAMAMAMMTKQPTVAFHRLERGLLARNEAVEVFNC
jgi:hypothetical protein